MWIGIISTIIAMIMLVWVVNLSLLWAFMVGGVIIAFIVLFAQKSKIDERITMLEINNQRLLSRIDSMMDKIESANLANLTKDSQKSVETSVESKKAKFHAHINESPTKPRESTFQSFESPRFRAESAQSTKTTTDSPQHINSTNATSPHSRGYVLWRTQLSRSRCFLWIQTHLVR